MLKNFYIEQQGKISGPFSRRNLEELLKNGSVQANDRISHDRISWYAAGSAVELLFPDFPEPPEITEISPESTPEQQAVILPSPEKTTQSGTPYEKKDIFLTVTAILGNGAENFLKFGSFSANAIISGGILCIVLSVFITFYACLLFGSLYNLSIMEIISRSCTFVLVAGVLLWLLLLPAQTFAGKQPKRHIHEMAFLAGMAGMMNMAAFTLITHSVMFVFNSVLFEQIFWRSTVWLLAALLPAGFFLCNTVSILRSFLLDNTAMNRAQTMIYAVITLWLTAPLYVILIQKIYTTV